MKKVTLKIIISSLVASAAFVGFNLSTASDKVTTVKEGAVAATVIHISQDELREKLKNPNTVLIDVRTQAEVDEGVIPGSIHIPIDDIINNVSVINEHIGKDLVFYCHSGVRANRVADFLIDINHPSKHNLFHLEGDMSAWRAKGNKIEMK